MLFSNFVEQMNLLDHLVVEINDIIRFDVCRFVLFEQGQLVSKLKDTREDGFFARIQRCLEGGGIGHNEEDSQGQGALPGFEIRPRGLGKVFLSNMPRVFVVSGVRTKVDRVIAILPKHAREQDT